MTLLVGIGRVGLSTLGAEGPALPDGQTVGLAVSDSVIHPNRASRQEGFVGNSLLLTTLAVVAVASVGRGPLEVSSKFEPKPEAQGYTQGLPIHLQPVIPPFVQRHDDLPTARIRRVQDWIYHLEIQEPPRAQQHIDRVVEHRAVVQPWEYYLEVPPPVTPPFVVQESQQPVVRKPETQGHISFDINAPAPIATPFIPYDSAQQPERKEELRRQLYRPDVPEAQPPAGDPFVRQEVQDPVSRKPETQGWTKWDINAPPAVVVPPFIHPETQDPVLRKRVVQGHINFDIDAPAPPIAAPFRPTLFDQVERGRDLDPHVAGGVSYFSQPIIPYADWPRIDLPSWDTNAHTLHYVIYFTQPLAGYVDVVVEDRRDVLQLQPVRSRLLDAPVVPPFIHPETQDPIGRKRSVQGWAKWDINAPAAPAPAPFIHPEIQDLVSRKRVTQGHIDFDINAPAPPAPAPFVPYNSAQEPRRRPLVQGYIDFDINAPPAVVAPPFRGSTFEVPGSRPDEAHHSVASITYFSEPIIPVVLEMVYLVDEPQGHILSSPKQLLDVLVAKPFLQVDWKVVSPRIPSDPSWIHTIPPDRIPPPPPLPFIPPDVGYIPDVVEREQWHGARMPHSIFSIPPPIEYLVITEIRIDPMLLVDDVEITPEMFMSDITIEIVP